MGRTFEKLIVRNYVDEVKSSEELIPREKVRQIEVDAIVDTGATYVCLSRRDIEALGLPYHESASIKTANGKSTSRTFEGAKVELKGRSFVTEVMENDEDSPAIIGSLLLDALDFVVDPQSQQVIPNPAHEGKWVVDCY